MNDISRNQLKQLLMDQVTSYILEKWEGAKAVKIDEEKTFTDQLSPAFYEKMEGNVDLKKASIPHTYGVLWTAEDVKLNVADDLKEEGEVSVFSKSYCNHTDAPIRISEKMEQGISVTDTCEIGFTDKISAGYEQTVSVGVSIMGVSAGTEIGFNMGVETETSQTTRKEVRETTTSGFSLEMEVPAKTVWNVEITATKKSCRVISDAVFIPTGKVYAQVSFNENPVTEDEHLYVIDLKEVDQDRLRFPITYIFAAAVHRNFEVQITSAGIKIESYPLGK